MATVSGFVPRRKIPSGPRARADRLKNLYTKSDILAVSCRVTLGRSEKVNLYHRQ